VNDTEALWKIEADEKYSKRQKVNSPEPLQSDVAYDVLFISFKFVKGFLAINWFFLLLISSWNFHDVCQRFLYNQ